MITGSQKIVTCGLLCALVLFPLLSCSHAPDPNTLVMIIEFSPTNLDPRVGVDAQSECIDALIFDDLLTRDEHLNAAPGLAELPADLAAANRADRFDDRDCRVRVGGRDRWNRGDVKWTFDSLMQGKIRSAKGGTYHFVDHIDAPDDYTVVFHLKEPSATLLWNLAGEAMGIVPFGSGDEMSQHPIGSGPFRFVSAELDKEIVLQRNGEYWGEKPRLDGVRFTVVPDVTTRALELRKGSADISSPRSLTSDMVLTLQREPKLEVLSPPGTVLAYMGFNLRDPILKDRRVRQAMAYAIDRRPLIHDLWRDFARPANSVLPPESWAYDGNTAKYDFDPSKSRECMANSCLILRNANSVSGSLIFCRVM